MGTPMKDSEYNQHVNDTLLAIEEAIDASGQDIDYETAAGILTLTIEANGSKIIINRQPPVQQLWLATRRTGLHFNWSDEAGDWVLDSNGTPFTQLLNEALVDQGAEALAL